MKILHLTDSHLTAKTPNSREDVYYHALLRKFEDLTTIIHENDVDFVIHTGDVFHTPRISLDVAGKLAHVFLEWGVPIYIVPGNHDIDGYNLSTIHQTMLGFLARTGVVKLLTRRRSFDIPYDCPDGSRLFVHLEGQEYYDDIDKGNPMDYALLEPKDFNILAVHGMLMDKPYFPEVPHTLIESVETDADIVLVGHYHPGFAPTLHNNTQFLNPGSLGRVEISEREPFVYLLDIRHQGKRNPKLYLHDFQPLKLPSVALSNEVFNFKAHQEKKAKKSDLLQFKASIEEAMSLSQTYSMEQLLDKTANHTHFPQKVVKQAKELIDQAKRENPSEVNEVRGYHVAKVPVWLTKVEINNFLSHSKTTIELHPKLNILIGETNSGKSSILRAILWCLYNEPKGVEFLRTGEKKVSVKCYFSNGYCIERTRNETQSGYYEITNPTGETERFSGFGSEVPIQIFDVHQMPPVFLTKDLSLKLNVNEQLDGPFLITESPQRKAQMVGRLVGTQYIDHAIKQLNKNILGDQRALKTHLEQLDRWEKECEEYKDLPLLEEHLNFFESLVERQEQLEQEITQLNRLKTDYEQCQYKKQESLLLLSSLLDLTEWNIQIEKVETLLEHLEKGEGVLQTYRRLIKDKQHLMNELKTSPDLTMFEEIIHKGEQRIAELHELIQQNQQLKRVEKQRQTLNKQLQPFDLSSFERMNEKAQGLIEQLEQFQMCQKAYTKLQNEKGKLNNYLKEIKDNYSKNEEVLLTLETQLRELYKKQGICPTCGSDLKEHQIHYLMEH